MSDNQSPKSSVDSGLNDPRSHNRGSLEALVAHVEEQCRSRIDEIDRRAADQAGRIRQSARAKAAELLREVRSRERRNMRERIRGERARQRSRIRKRELAERRTMAEQGLDQVRQALVKLWHQDERARAAWLKRALSDARTVMTEGDWSLRHPEDWSPDEALAARVAQNARIEWQADPALCEGLVVSAGKAVVDATPTGLTARGARIGGVLLATLPALDAEVES